MLDLKNTDLEDALEAARAGFVVIAGCSGIPRRGVP